MKFRDLCLTICNVSLLTRDSYGVGRYAQRLLQTRHSYGVECDMHVGLGENHPWRQTRDCGLIKQLKRPRDHSSRKLLLLQKPLLASKVPTYPLTKLFPIKPRLDSVMPQGGKLRSCHQYRPIKVGLVILRDFLFLRFHHFEFD